MQGLGGMHNRGGQSHVLARLTLFGAATGSTALSAFFQRGHQVWLVVLSQNLHSCVHATESPVPTCRSAGSQISCDSALLANVFVARSDLLPPCTQRTSARNCRGTSLAGRGPRTDITSVETVENGKYRPFCRSLDNSTLFSEAKVENGQTSTAKV